MPEIRTEEWVVLAVLVIAIVWMLGVWAKRKWQWQALSPWLFSSYFVPLWLVRA